MYLVKPFLIFLIERRQRWRVCVNHIFTKKVFFLIPLYIVYSIPFVFILWFHCDIVLLRLILSQLLLKSDDLSALWVCDPALKFSKLKGFLIPSVIGTWPKNSVNGAVSFYQSRCLKFIYHNGGLSQIWLLAPGFLHRCDTEDLFDDWHVA